MSSMPVAYYVDDEQAEAKANIARLNSAKSLEFRYLRPPKNMSLKGISQDARLFLVDWELDAEQENGTFVDYRGSTLATVLREKFDDLPIVLITREDVLDERTRQRYVASLLFDDYIPKRSIIVNPAATAERCLRLIQGFNTLGKAVKTWEGLVEALKATEEEAELLGEAAPPLFKTSFDQDSSNVLIPSVPGDGATWRVAEAAKWVQDIVLKYPGIVYDPLHAATFLGIHVDAFSDSDVQTLFESARYQGVFASPEGYWWRNRLLSIAQEFIAETELAETSVNRGFAGAFAQVYKRELAPSSCIYSGKTPADWVCYILKQPVRIEFSLAYHPDSRPPIMDDARVSFTAIRESNQVFDELFDSSSRELLESIRR